MSLESYCIEGDQSLLILARTTIDMQVTPPPTKKMIGLDGVKDIVAMGDGLLY